MKKKLFLFVLLFSVCSTYAFSAGIYENANQSAEFIRTLTRYASTDIDSAFYNPAGTVFMKDGLYAYFSDQMIFDYQEITDNSPYLSGKYPSKYKGEAMTWAFPDIYTIYRKNDFSAFFNAGIIGRGAAATYNESLPSINKLIGILDYPDGGNGRLEAYAFFISFTLGGAYKLNEIFSIGGGVRYIHAEQNTKIEYNNVNVNVDANGDSCGFIGGFDVKPIERMNIGFRYEYYTTMEVKNNKPNEFEGPSLIISALQSNGLGEGDITKMTLPNNATIGISYKIIPDLTVESGFIYYFNKQTDWGKDASGGEIAKKYDNGYDISISFEYAFLPQLKGSTGYSYSVSGVNSQTRSNQQFGLTANTIAFGGTYTFSNGIDFTAATAIVLFKNATESNSNGSIPGDSGYTEYKERAYSVAGSVSYKFL